MTKKACHFWDTFWQIFVKQDVHYWTIEKGPMAFSAKLNPWESVDFKGF